MSIWQPINTAPKNKEIIVAKRFESEIDLMWITRWKYIATWHINEWVIWSTGLSGISGGTCVFKLDEPTHWMPIPTEDTP